MSLQTSRKFRAPTFDEAYRRMRNALGQDAVVLRTVEVKEGGIFGLFAKKRIELTAVGSATHPSAVPHRARTGAQSAYARAAACPKQPPRDSDDTVAYYERLVTEAQQRIGLARGSSLENGNAAVAPVIPFRKPERAPAPEDVRRELREMREMLQVLVTETPGAGLPAEFVPHYRALLTQGVSRRLAAQLVAAVQRGSDLPVLRDPRVFRERLRLEIRRRVQVSGGVGLVAGTCKVVALIGATGVGKTTSLAKLAALFAVRARSRVAMVTADTYRIAAPEQLRVYANIIGLPLTVVNEPKEMLAALRAYRDYDLVLMDTAGGSHFNTAQMRETQAALCAAQPDEALLVLSANTQLGELRNIVAGFKGLRPSSLFFAKLDETRQYGALLSLAAEAGLPLSYFGTGQNVPDDIALASPAGMANLVLEGRLT